MQFLLIISAVMFVWSTILFGISIWKKDNSIADIAWGMSGILCAAISFFYTPLSTPRKIIATTLVIIWGLRITLHLLGRKWGKGEDARYTQMRKNWQGAELLYSYLYVFLLQGFLMLIIASPVMVINIFDDCSLYWFDSIAIALWIAGFLFEVIGDYQLEQFVSQPENKGRIMRYGLWRYTRHPNYFGESCMWWALFLLALPVKYGWLTIASPLLITGLLLFVSGIPLIEKQFAHNLEYQAYKKETSPFIPWFVKEK